MKLTPFNVAVVDEAHDRFLSRWIEQQGRLDVAREWLETFRPLMPAGGTVVDVGACVGDHTVTYAAFVGPAGHVYAFEPNPAAFACLTHNLRACPHVHLSPIALGRGPAQGVLEVNRVNLGNARVRVSSAGAVSIVALDSLTSEWPRLDFLKIDAEGMELDILAGAEQTIRRLRPRILMEVNADELKPRGLAPHALYQAVERLGYTWKEVRRVGLSETDILAEPCA